VVRTFNTATDVIRTASESSTSANLAELLRRAAEDSPNAAAIDDGSLVTDYRTLAARAGGIAGELQRLGLARGQRVAILIHRNVEAVSAFFGVLAAGGIAVNVTRRCGTARSTTSFVILAPAS